MGVLSARFVDRSRRQRRQIVDRRSLIGVVEGRATAHVAEPADVAGVVAGDVVVEIAQLQARSRRRLVIDATEHIGAVVAGREIAGADARTVIAHRVQRRVHREHRRRRDGHHSGSILQRLFDVAEPERPVLHQRTTQRQTELILVQRILANRERILRVERIVPEEFVRSTLVLVGARLRDDADRSARGAAEFGAAARGHHFELADDLLAQRHPRQIRRIIVGGHPVEDEVVVQVALTRDRDAGSRYRRRLGESIGRAQVRPRHVGRQQCQVEVVASIERKAVDLARRDRGRHFRSPRLDQRHRRRHLDGLGDRRRPDHDRHVHLVANVQREPGVGRAKAAQLDREVVVAGGKIRESKLAASIRHRLPGLVGRVIADFNRRPRDDSAARIANRTRDTGRSHGLGRRRRSHRTQTHKRQPGGSRTKF